ncbi:MAG: hypothetical protein M0P09_06520, partial [Acholeplasmataceae bacterium]|nr:hypothetical protein [Acholeplasmataceae bacterium]
MVNMFIKCGNYGIIIAIPSLYVCLSTYPHRPTTTKRLKINKKRSFVMIFSINRDVLLNHLIIVQKGLPVKTPLP